MPPAGYIGPLPGLYFDPIRGKYFTDRPSTLGSGPGPSTSASRAAADLATSGATARPPRRPANGNGRDRRPRQAGETIESRDPSVCGAKNSLGTRRLRPPADGRRGAKSSGSHEKSLYANLALDKVMTVAGDGDSITALRSYANGRFHGTTMGGCVILQTNDDPLPSAIAVCSEPLIGIHTDLARSQGLAVSGGEDPHFHHWTWDLYSPHGPEVIMDAKSLAQDVHCMSSFDSFCSLGARKSVITIRFDSDVRIVSRNLPSDALAIHHHSHDIRYIGLRNSQVIRADLREPFHASNVIASMQRGKAVVAVKKLDDAAIPFGLLASGMSNEVWQDATPQSPGAYQFVPYQPRELSSHLISTSAELSRKGLCTAANDSVVFAAGSDQRVRAWSLHTGERLRPDHDADVVSPVSQNPLTRSFNDKPTTISITEDGMMDVGVNNAIHRFRPGRDGRPSKLSDSAVRNWEDSDTFM